MIPSRSRFLSLSAVAALAFAVAGCGLSSSPPPPPGGTDPPPPVVAFEKIPEGPAKSGSDVRLPWIVTDGGARVREGEIVIAKGLSETYKLTVPCSFGPNSDPATSKVVCYPMYPAAVTDSVGNLYADGTCGDDARLVVESQAQRLCQTGALRFAVLALPGADACKRNITVRELTPVATPSATFVITNGRCVPDAAGRQGLNYFLATRIIPDGELPHGTRGIE